MGLISIPLITQKVQEDTAWILVNCVIVVMSILGSFLQNGTFALAGVLPSKYMAVVMFGNGVSGILVCFIRAV
jgi:hypothetical protein